jgi:pimeloyl-ACP methyl ester carboxylesterase
MWMIELRYETPIGDLCFKGIQANGMTEIGYGILEDYQGQGYASEAVDATVTWALQQAAVTRVEAETEPGNRASQRVLEKCGFLPSGTFGEEGPRFFKRRFDGKKDAVLYIHGKGGSAAECEHYRPLFPDCEVLGLDYQTFTPWECGAEIRAAAEKMRAGYKSLILIANSIGAFFSMSAGIDDMIQKAYFISPIVDMEKLICDMMAWANVSEAELQSKGIIPTAFGEDLSWAYLCYVRNHPIRWTVPTQILYGSRDDLTALETIRDFAEKHNALLTVMEGGEHWFHTEEQMRFLDEWLQRESGKEML